MPAACASRFNPLNLAGLSAESHDAPFPLHPRSAFSANVGFRLFPGLRCAPGRPRFGRLGGMRERTGTDWKLTESGPQGSRSGSASGGHDNLGDRPCFGNRLRVLPHARKVKGDRVADQIVVSASAAPAATQPTYSIETGGVKTYGSVND